jgi:Protein of unknown function (DUF3887)
MKRLSSLLLATIVSSTVVYTLHPNQAYADDLLVQANPVNNSDVFQKRAEELILLMNNKDFTGVRAKLAPQLQRFWPPEKIQKQWEEDILEVQGDFQKILKSKVVDIVNGTTVIVTVQFSQSPADLIITFNSQGELVGLDFPETSSVEQISQTFVESLSKKDYGLARHFLHPYLKTEFFPEKVQKKWQDLEASSGTYEKLLDIQIQPKADKGNVAILKLQFSKATRTFILIFDKNKRIIGVDLVTE